MMERAQKEIADGAGYSVEEVRVEARKIIETPMQHTQPRKK